MTNDTTVPPKRCTKCGEYFPPTSQYFIPRSSSKDGLRSDCRTCVNTAKRDRYKANPAITKASQARYRKNNPQKEAQRHRIYRKNNLDKVTKQIRQWRDNNPQKVAEYDRQYRERNPDKVKQRKQHWRQNNAHKIKTYRQSYRADHPNQDRVWKQANRDKVRQYDHRRRARKRNLPATFTDEQEIFARQYFEGRCAICGRLPDFWHIIAMDHWIAITDPRSDNPGTVATNMVPMCHSIEGVPANDAGCNNSKHDATDPLEWLISRYGKRIGKRKYDAIMAYFAYIAEQDKHD